MNEFDREREQIRAWIAENWDPNLVLREWWRRLAEAGYAFPTWPEGLGGRGWTGAQAATVANELHQAGAVGPPAGVGQNLAGPTLIAHGTDEQKRRWVPAIADGTEAWCQLFSEPSAGSDLASLRTKAIRDGEQWLVSGQKVWNSGASTADRGMLLARTDISVPKHEGISWFAIDMGQAAVETRPLRQMNGRTEFDEVFLTDAIVPDDALVGGLGNGWRVAQTTLGFERASIGSRGAGGFSFPAGVRNGCLDIEICTLIERALTEAERKPRISGYVLGSRTVAELAKMHGRTADPVIRQQLAAYRSMVDVNRWTAQRARENAKGGRPGAESSIGKLAISNLARVSRDLGLSLLGAHGMLAGGSAPHGGGVQDVALSSFAAGIGGGTDEIQRNIIGERALGLPKEPQPDHLQPSREVAATREREDHDSE